jgi:hypothetical protein
LGEEQQRQQAQDPTTAEQRQCQRQQREDQQVALVFPGVGGAIPGQGRFAFGEGRFRQQEIQVRVVDLQGRVAPTTGGGQLAQGLFIQGRHHDAAVPVFEESTARQGYRCPAGGAHAHHRQGGATVAQRALDSTAIFLADAIGHQQHPATADSGGAQQLQRLLHRSDRVAARHRHHPGGKRRQQVGNRGGIIGKGRHDVGVPGIGNEGGLALPARGQQVQQFLPGPVEARGSQVP